MRYEIRPLGTWIGPVTPAGTRKPPHYFKASWQSTLELLNRETRMLGARLVVIQIDVTEGEIRRDGMLYARTRVGFPGVRVSFDSRHGPLTYATDQYAHWQANVRAIALSLEALRAVDRYGVTGSGEQYRGWLAIEAAPAAMPVEAARALLESYGGVKAALKQTHPDHGGNVESFHQVQEARRVLGI